MKKIETTICKKCKTQFKIHPNRSYKIRENTNFVWFVDAMNQFENFREVQCPSCGAVFKADEARLFGMFRSPYTAVLCSVIFVSLMVGIPILIKLFL